MALQLAVQPKSAGEVIPDCTIIQHEFARNSIVWMETEQILKKLWEQVRTTPDAQLKYNLWSRFLGFAYGSEIEDESLFLRHTYLTVLVKAIAWQAISGGEISAEDLVLGEGFLKHGIIGLGGDDFFGWILNSTGGIGLIERLRQQVARFNFHNIKTDILKGLYESLIDPEERHELGEYYTPDWLAAHICAEAMDNPLRQRVLDPSCGSGTFIFHATRRIIEAGEAADMLPERIVSTITSNVAGIDIHPVAATVAQATFLLAILPVYENVDMTQGLEIPIFLGDSLQRWINRPDADDIFATDRSSLNITAPKMTVGKRTLQPMRLTFPISLIGNPILFSHVINAMLELGKIDAKTSSFRNWMKNNHVPRFDHDPLASTYKSLRTLQAQDRNHIWGFVSRSLVRPIYFTEHGRADILLGNPPWVAYNRMTHRVREIFKKQCIDSQLWVGGKDASTQDLSAYFFNHAAKLYLKDGGKLAFVMPRAALTRPAYAKFRQGDIYNAGDVIARLDVTAVWDLPADLKPLFPVPACVIFAHKQADWQNTTPSRPDKTTRFSGTLPMRDADWEAAEPLLTIETADYPKEISGGGGDSVYHDTFKIGATLIPRRFVLVCPIIGFKNLSKSSAPFVRGRVSNLDKLPWSNIPPLEGNIESEFLRPVLLGSSIAPYRQLGDELGIIPIRPCRKSDDFDLLDSKGAERGGFLGLNAWLRDAESLWNKHQDSKMSFAERINYHNGLTLQFPIAPLRVVYAASGTQLAACVITDDTSIIESALYWMAAETLDEAYYLTAILNSDTAKAAMIPLQAQGQFGARHVSRYPLYPPWPRYRAEDTLHQDIADAARAAEKAAAQVALPETVKFQKARSLIRDHLAATKIVDTINILTAKLLP